MWALVVLVVVEVEVEVVEAVEAVLVGLLLLARVLGRVLAVVRCCRRGDVQAVVVAVLQLGSSRFLLGPVQLRSSVSALFVLLRKCVSLRGTALPEVVAQSGALVWRVPDVVRLPV